MDSHDKGDHAELRVAAELKRQGWNVLLPYDENGSYDLVAEDGSEFVRIQVKASTFNGTSVVFSCTNSANKARNNQTTYTDSEIDGFGVYSVERDQCYYVPVEEGTQSTATINVKNDDAKRPAAEYRLEDRF
jgi:hypothetical protein